MNLWRQFKEKSDTKKGFIMWFVLLWILYLVYSLSEVNVTYAVIGFVLRNVILIPLVIVYIWRDKYA